MRRLVLILSLLVTSALFAQDSNTDDAPASTADSEEASPVAPAQSEPTTVSEIVVTAGYDWCDPAVMQRRLPAADELLTNFVDPPGWQFGGAPTTNPNFFVAGAKSAHIKDIDYTNQKMTLFARYLSCATAKCDGIIAANSHLTLERETRYGWEDDSSGRHYTVSGEIEFSQMYDAKHEDVEISCPLATCQGIIFYGPKNRNFYTATRAGDRIERKLVVNGGLESRFITRPTSSTLERCPPVQPPEPPQNQRSRPRR